jgi:hypothetical protein
MYESNRDGPFDPGEFELLPHERLSEAWPEDFRRYFDRWVRYWPKNGKAG